MKWLARTGQRFFGRLRLTGWQGCLDAMESTVTVTRLFRSKRPPSADQTNCEFLWNTKRAARLGIREELLSSIV